MGSPGIEVDDALQREREVQAVYVRDVEIGVARVVYHTQHHLAFRGISHIVVLYTVTR